MLTVSDNGAGITPELLPYVFDLFVQSDRTLDRTQGGLGIGLSIVKRTCGWWRSPGMDSWKIGRRVGLQGSTITW